MLGIWHEGEWIKIYLAQPIHGRVERGSPIPSWFLHSLMRNSFPFFSCVNVFVYMWILLMMYFLYFPCYYDGYVYVL